MSDTSGPAVPSAALQPYDAVILVSFGGPEQPDDVVPFLRNVTRGRGIPTERLVEVGEHYFRFGGKSPINEQCRALQSALAEELARRRHDLPLYWGNRNWTPYLDDEMRRIETDGHRRVLAVITTAYPSYSSCRQYRENLADAVQGTEVSVDRLRHYSHTPGFVTAFVDSTSAALAELGPAADPRLVFVTHAIPTAMAETSGPPPRSPEGGYLDWHRVVAAEVTARVSQRHGRELAGELVFCSRSGPPSQPWTEPDVNDHLAALSEQGVDAVVVVPIGFVSDHMEVIYDLDTEAAETAAKLGLGFARAGTAGVHHAFVAGLVDLIEERAAAARGERPATPVIPNGRVGPYLCPPNCCPNLIEPGRPAVCQAAGSA